MNQLSQIFMYEGAQVRTVIINDQPWMVAKDVCAILEIQNTTQALQRLDPDEVTMFNIGGLHGETNLVNEYGLYSLILGSRKAEAKSFKRWVTHEVLPAIRKTGSYSSALLPSNYIEALEALVQSAKDTIQLQEQNAHKDAQLKLQEPKVALYDVAMSAEGAQPVGTVAKELGLGRTRLFALLREKKVLRQNNEPYQEFIERGYFKLRMYTITHKTSGLENKTQPMVTPKGIAWLHKLIVGA